MPREVAIEPEQGVVTLRGDNGHMKTTEFFQHF